MNEGSEAGKSSEHSGSGVKTVTVECAMRQGWKCGQETDPADWVGFGKEEAQVLSRGVKRFI